jgi:hypothetical protein
MSYLDLGESAMAQCSIQEADEMRHSRSICWISRIFWHFLWSYGRDWFWPLRKKFEESDWRRKLRNPNPGTIFEFLIMAISWYRKTLFFLSFLYTLKGYLRNISSPQWPENFGARKTPRFLSSWYDQDDSRRNGSCGIRTFRWSEVRSTGMKTSSMINWSSDDFFLGRTANLRSLFQWNMMNRSTVELMYRIFIMLTCGCEDAQKFTRSVCTTVHFSDHDEKNAFRNSMSNNHIVISPAKQGMAASQNIGARVRDLPVSRPILNQCFLFLVYLW